MSYRIEVSPAAQKELKFLPGYVRSQALQLIDLLAENPKPVRAKELREKRNLYRIWLSKNWRIVYELDDELKVILIMRVRHKEQIDYPSL